MAVAGERVGHPSMKISAGHPESSVYVVFTNGQPHWSGIFHDAAALELLL